MKLFVYGNCQAASYGAALRSLTTAEAVYVAGHDAYERVADCDIVLVQTEFWQHAHDPKGLMKLGNQTLIKVPTFYFAGFAPDAIIEHIDGRPLVCPAGHYNSSIALHGFLSGLSVEQTLSLFTAKTFEALEFGAYWEPSRHALIADIDACGLDGERLFGEFVARGRFAYSPHHPPIAVFDAIVRDLVVRHGLPASGAACSDSDPMAINGDWPLYPGLLPELDLPRSFDICFDPPLPGQTVKAPIPLADFVRRSFAAYAALPQGSIVSERLTRQADLYARITPPVPRRPQRQAHVYADLPTTSYWRGSVAALPVAEVDPIVSTKWRIGPGDRIATAGSCFAQHIARTLVEAGRQFLDCEPAPLGLDPSEAARRHFGVFSARYGNVYTARQLAQLVARAMGSFRPADVAWQRPDGRFIDPFRPQIEPDGFASVADTIASTEQHLRAVLAMLESMDVLVFTLGLTETWASAIDGAVFPVAPGVVAGEMDPQRYRFLNFTAAQVRADLRRALELMRDINPRLKVILTVSPVPLVATYEARHVLVSTTFSKSALRVAAEEIVADYGFADYFPSYEMITGPHARGCYFEADKRSVSAEGVDQVMGVFKAHYLDAEAAPARRVSARAPVPRQSPILAEIAARSRFLCDEEALDRTSGSEEMRLDYAAT